MLSFRVSNRHEKSDSIPTLTPAFLNRAISSYKNITSINREKFQNISMSWVRELVKLVQLYLMMRYQPSTLVIKGIMAKIVPMRPRRTPQIIRETAVPFLSNRTLYWVAIVFLANTLIFILRSTVNQQT